MTDPPAEAAVAAADCRNEGWWPVLVGDALLVAPMILPDQPAVAPESPGDLFDATEIDEILTLRVLTLTEQEKVAARGTDPRAAAILERCDALSPEQMARLHGARRDPDPPAGPAADAVAHPWAGSDEVPWWDPGADASVSPETDAVLVGGVAVRKGSRVRLRPSRRADAQDMFLAGQTALVTAVLSDVDGAAHVAVVLADDPAADLHDWYGRYWYFAPDEIEPLPPEVPFVTAPGAGRRGRQPLPRRRRLRSRGGPPARRPATAAGRSGGRLRHPRHAPRVRPARRLRRAGDRRRGAARRPPGRPDGARGRRGRPGRSGDFDGHGMEPTAVLSSLGSLGGRLPRTYVVGCEPADLGRGHRTVPARRGGGRPPVDAVLHLLTVDEDREGP